MKSFAKRLSTGTDLRASIEEMVSHYNIAAGAVLSADGVLSRAELKVADGEIYNHEGQFIITSCTGTAALDAVNLELRLMGPNGDTITGELLEGCVVGESVDLVIGAVESSTAR